MKFIKIPKKNGEYRNICVPDANLKKSLRKLLANSLNEKQFKYCNLDIVHGFVPTRSIVTNANKHKGFRYTLSFDLKDFFDSVTPDMVKDYLTKEEINQCFINGRAYQGLPTSPSVCNLAAAKMDREIYSFLFGLFEGNKKIFAYTRYADDLAISYGLTDEKYRNLYPILKEKIVQIIENSGFRINPQKTRLQIAKFGHREITGLYATSTDIRVSRKFKRKLRAARYKKTFSLDGLEEFARCKFPCAYLPHEQINNIYNTVIYFQNQKLFLESTGQKYSGPIISSITLAGLDQLRKSPREDITKEYVKHVVAQMMLYGEKKFKSILKRISKLTFEKRELVYKK